MKYLFIAISFFIMVSAASAQTPDDRQKRQIIKKEKEKTTATIFIHKNKVKKDIPKKKAHRNKLRKKPVPRGTRQPKPSQEENTDALSSGMEMEMGTGMEQMQNEMQGNM